VVHLALEAVSQGGEGALRVLDRLPAAIYMTDAAGVVTYHNNACIPFAGRRPVVRQDSWCVTWKLYTQDGEYLPHDQCPMAVAIREKRAIRGVQAVAGRPDGSYVGFQPYPTPLFDQDGKLVGAINLLFDVSGPEQAHGFRARAAKCRRFVNLMPGQREALLFMAADYDEKARGIEQRN
jgi:PAS domain-containing protein